MILNTEYKPYYEPYISLFVGRNMSIIQSLQESRDFLLETLKNLPKEKEEFVYEQGKWTLKELLQHVIDTERIFNYRALRFARNDKTELQGFDQDEYNFNSKANSRELELIIEEFLTVRNSTIALFSSFDSSTLKNLGRASGNVISVRAIGYVIAGHSQHHIKIFKERYL